MVDVTAVLVTDEPDPWPAAAWALRTAGPGSVVELVAPWRRGQSEWLVATGGVVDAPTAAHLRLLALLDRLRAVQPDAPLRLRPVAGSPVDVVARLDPATVLLVLPARGGRRRPRSRALLAAAPCPVAVVGAGRDGTPELLLRAAQGSRQEGARSLLRRLSRT